MKSGKTPESKKKTTTVESSDASLETKKLVVLYEDAEVVVIDKPSGLVVHSDGKTDEPTLVDWLLEHYPEIENVGEPWEAGDGKVIPRPGIVHRLDRETSGVMVIAKTQESFEHLKKQFQNRTIEKTYNAFVHGLLADDDGIIDRQIGKSNKDFRMWSAQRGARGALRDAVTEYTVLKRFPEMTYIEVRPKTGRTHQIRVHFKAIHHPVVCDSLYAPKHDCMGFSRLALHARSITFQGLDGENVSVEALLPQGFKDVAFDSKEE